MGDEIMENEKKAYEDIYVHLPEKNTGKITLTTATKKTLLVRLG